MKNMSKYDTMIALNKKASEEKMDKAKKAIWKMLEDGEKVTIPKLMAKTGLSRGFFYKNPAVRKEFDRAMQQQAGMVDPKRYIGDMALKSRVELLELQVRELKRENERLEKEKKKLEKALDKKEMNFIKNL
jgi:chaperonin cofactor prefoldin